MNAKERSERAYRDYRAQADELQGWLVKAGMPRAEAGHWLLDFRDAVIAEQATLRALLAERKAENE